MKVGVLFPGYGSHYVGMGKELYDHSRLIQEYFEEASHCLNNNFVKLCFASSDAELSKLVNAHTALFLVQSALSALLKDLGVQPAVIAGYGIGEYAAFFSAGGINLPDGLYLLTKFSYLYEELLEQSSLRALWIYGISASELQLLIPEDSAHAVSISHYNSAIEHRVIGTQEAIELLEDTLKQQRIKMQHSMLAQGIYAPLALPLQQNFQVYLEKVDCKDLAYPVINASTGRIVRTSKQVRERIIHASELPVHWTTVINKLASCDVMVIIGAAPTLRDTIQTAYPTKTVIMLDKMADLDAICTTLKLTYHAREPLSLSEETLL